MSDQTKKRRREATIEAPSLEEIGVPFARRQRLDGGSEGRSVISVENWSTGQVAERLRDRGVGDDTLQLFRENKIAGRHLAGLSKGDLTDMGIGAVGTQKDVLETVKTILSQCRKKELEKVFNDPVHGHIELHPLMVRFMDTPQFQRLRYIKQLGGGYYVFPGASHNRFEHSIGVGYLAGELAETLQRKQRELDITDADVLCVKLAGLCHDLGHGPFSHLFDGKFIPKVLPESKWKHEVASVMMLDHLIEENGLMEEMMRYGLDENDVTFIKELIIGAGKNANETPTTPPRHDWEYKGRPESKSFLYEIVANKRTGVDVDKWDYFARDCHHLGIPNSFDLGRYMTFVRVNEVDTTYEGQVVHRRRQICTRDKEATNLYEMFHTRSMLHRRAYQHKTSNIIEEMVTEALVAANDHLLIPGKDGKKVKMSEAIEDPVAFTRLTDQVLQQIQLSTDPNLQKAKDILAKVETRRLYKHVGQTQALTPLDKADGARIGSEMINSLSPDDPELDGLPPLSEDDIIVLIATFDYGKKEENPIDQMRFYTKETPHKAKRVRKDQVSQMLPPTFREQQIRVFCRKDDKPSLDAAWKYFTKWCSKQKCVTPTGSGAPDDSPNSGDTTLTTSPYIAPVDREHCRTPVNSSVIRNLF